MKFEEIEVGKVYAVTYIDPNYPCDCKCHQPGSKVIHFMACCHDRSYKGFATCLGAFDDGESHLYATDRRRFIRILASNVSGEAEGEEPIYIDDKTRKFVHSVLGAEE